MAKPISEAQKRAQKNYMENLKRIEITVSKEMERKIKAAAYDAGKPVATYIKQAIEEKIEREKAGG